MKSKPKQRFSLDEFARRLEQIRSVDAAGKVSFSGIEFTELELVLLTSLDWNPSLCNSERQLVASRAPFEAGTSGSITKQSLLMALESLEKKMLAAPAKKYSVVSTLSILHSTLLSPISVNDVEFSFHLHLPAHFDRKAIEFHIEQPEVGPSLPACYTVVCGEVTARSPAVAVSSVLTSLDILRGIWNFVINYHILSQWTFGGGRWKPVNKLRLGPISTVHTPDGKLAANLWWSDPCFAAADPVDLKGDWPTIQKNATWCFDQWRLIPYKEDADEFWVRYARALDRSDYEANFLKLWSLLELLTGTTGDRYDETIKRTLFVCGDREFNRLILEHLRDCRNASVHRDESLGEVDRYLFQIKRYVEELIRLHLAWAGKFRSLHEVGEFLTLPAEPTLLTKRIQLLIRGLRFRRGTLRKT